MRLENEEKIIFKVHPHWFYVVVPEFTLAILGTFSSHSLMPYFPNGF
jgi:hypothetical protein